MKEFTFQVPSKVIYGKHSINNLKKILVPLGKRAMIITDDIMLKLGNVKKVTDILSEVSLNYTIYSGVNSEPDSDHVKEALKACEDAKCEFVVSIGGGSCIDLAKTVSVLAYQSNNEKINPMPKIKKDPLKHIAIPTTTGTGSEVTNVSVIKDLETNQKLMMQNSYYTPTVALVDSKLTYSCPNKIIASTGVDAFCHAIESLMSVKVNPFSEKFAWSAIETILTNIEKAYTEKDNGAYMDNMALASLEAGIAFSNSSVCLVHGMSRPLGAIFNIPHGVSNAMLLNTVLEFNRKYILNILEKIGRFIVNNNLIESASIDQMTYSDIAMYKMKNLLEVLEIPSISDWGVDKHSFKRSLDKMANDALASGSPQNNPVVPTVEQLKELYLKSF